MKDELKTPPTLEELRERSEKFKNRKLGGGKAEVPPTPEMIEYAKKIKALKEADKDISLTGLMASVFGNKKGRQITPYPISFEDGKKLFIHILQNELEVNGNALVLEEANQEKVNELLKYFMGLPCRLNAKKGIYLYGAVGRGKTVIMQALMIFCNTVESKLTAADKLFTPHKFQLKNAKSIVNELAQNKKADVIKQYYTGALCIDDLGAEDSYKLYGNDMDVVGDIIVERYQKYQHYGQLTHATSNTKPSDWNGKYGERVESRLSEMFNVIVLLGKDKRK